MNNQQVADSSQSVDILLGPFRQVLGNDYEKYRNHVCRVFYNCLMMDKEETNAGKYAVASVFHDIGIWTDNTIDYLAPSIERARQYLATNDKTAWIEEVHAMIYWHHKISPYSGAFKQTVETFRKADYTDVSLGLFTYGFNRKIVAANRKKFPNAGFHFFLVKKIVNNFFRHPFNPLPMFTR